MKTVKRLCAVLLLILTVLFVSYLWYTGGQVGA